MKPWQIVVSAIAVVAVGLGTFGTFQSIGLGSRAGNIEDDVSSVGDRASVLEDNVSLIDAGIISIEGHITSIKGNIATIETDIGTLQVDLSDVNAEITSIEGNIATIETDIGTLQVNVSDINAEITSLEGDIATIETDVGTIEVNIATINGRITSIEGDIAIIETDVGTIITKIGTNVDPAGTTTLFAWMAKLFASGQMAQGLVYYGKVTQVDDATHFRVASLVGLGDAFFTNNYRVYVLRDAGGTGAAPQGEMQPCSGYTSSTGRFTHTAFSVGLAVNDEVLLLHEGIAQIADLVAALVILDAFHDVPAADAVANLQMRDVIGQKGDSADYTAGATQSSLMRLIKGLLGITVIAEGTLTTSSATVPADTGRTEGNDFFKGCVLMTLAGGVAFQPRPIRQFTSGTDVFTLDEPFTAAPGLVAYVILASDYPVQRLLDILNAVNAILTLTETGGTLTANGTEQNIYINNAPAGEFEPRVVLVDLDNMQAGDTIVFRVYYRLRAGGGLQLYDYVQYTGADGGLTDGRKLIAITLLPNRFGVRVTLQQTAGVNRSYDWDAHYED